MDDDGDDPDRRRKGFPGGGSNSLDGLVEPLDGLGGPVQVFFCFFKSLTATGNIRCSLQLMGLTAMGNIRCPLRLMGLTTAGTLCCPLR